MGDEKGRREERENEKVREREKENHARTMRVESIVVGMGASRWEGYNERLAIFSINIFRRFAQRQGVLVERPLVARIAVRLRGAAIRRNYAKRTFPQSIERASTFCIPRKMFRSGEDLLRDSCAGRPSRIHDDDRIIAKAPRLSVSIVNFVGQ